MSKVSEIRQKVIKAFVETSAGKKIQRSEQWILTIILNSFLLIKTTKLFWVIRW